MGVMDDGVAAAAVPGQSAPDLTAAHAAALAAVAAGDCAAALPLYDTVLTLDPDHVEALAGRGAALRALGRPHEALHPLWQALCRRPDHATARIELALALGEAGYRVEADSLYALLLRQDDGAAKVWHGLARLALANDHTATAEVCLRRATALDPSAPAYRLDLAHLLARRGDLAEAAEGYNEVLALHPDNADAHAGLGRVLTGLGRLDEAETRLERALALAPDNAAAHLARAHLRLLAGDDTAAWADLEWRWSLPGRHRPDALPPAWDGVADLAGRTILLWAEEGLAETIHALRHVPALAQRGARVVLGVPQALATLAAGMAGVERVLASGQAVPAELDIDVQASLVDLPRLLGGDDAPGPAAPYLSVPAGYEVAVPLPAPALLKVGMAWAGSQPERDVPLDRLMPILALPGVVAHSLQTGPRARDAARLAHPALIAEPPPFGGDLADLAARIAAMDVVVAADGVVAHLAGALGVPVCVLVPTVPDWRWRQEREESPDYPTARLFRQHGADPAWQGAVQAVCTDLRDRLADIRAKREDGARMRSNPGAATQAFLAAHLEAGDLVIDAGAGSGETTLAAAAHPGGDIHVLAVEARRAGAGALADIVAGTGATERVEVVTAALAAHHGPAVVAAQPRGGRSVFALPAWVRGGGATLTLDALLADRPALTGRRLVLRLGATGQQDDILAGLSVPPALVVFDHRDGDGTADHLRGRGYTLWRFGGPLACGPLVAFTGEVGPVLALAAGIDPADSYGDDDDPHGPAAILRAQARADALAAAGADALHAGDRNRAAACHGDALTANPDHVEALTHLGDLLHQIGRLDAAAACWRRALAAGAGADVLARLGNALRLLGRDDEAADAFDQAAAAAPDNPDVLYGFGLLERQRGRSRAATALFDRAEALRPGTVPGLAKAAALLQSGQWTAGMAALADRPSAGLMPLDAPMWEGDDLDGRTIVVRDEGDAIDTLMLARFLPLLGLRGGEVVVECVPEAARLIADLPGVAGVVPRGQMLPVADTGVHLPDLPRLLGLSGPLAAGTIPYLSVPDAVTPRRFGPRGRLRVGIAWSGRPTEPGVPLEVLLRLAGDARIHLVSLQRGERATDLAAYGAHMLAQDAGRACADLADSAGCIAGLDVVVAADSAEAHLAAAMGKPTWVMLARGADWRWVDGRDDSVWYPTMRVFRQSPDGSWHAAQAAMLRTAAAMAAGRLATADSDFRHRASTYA